MASNKDEEADEERSSFRHRICRLWKSLKLRSALGHAGLMISLSIYCVVGGVVSMSKVCVCGFNADGAREKLDGFSSWCNNQYNVNSFK